MNRRWISTLCSLAVVAPLAVDFRAPDPDSSATSVRIAAGGGSYGYVTRGCEGQVIDRYQRRFRDAGVEVKHRFDGPVEVGVRAQQLRSFPDYEKNLVVWNPFLSIEADGGGFGIGLTFRKERAARYYHDRELDIPRATGHLRIGSPRSAYVSMHVFEDVPIVSGGGPIRLGLGIHAGPVLDWWIGAGFLDPYDKIGAVAKADLHVTRFLDVNFSGRLGGTEGLSENAGSVGITLRRSRVTRE